MTIDYNELAEKIVQRILPIKSRYIEVKDNLINIDMCHSISKLGDKVGQPAIDFAIRGGGLLIEYDGVVERDMAFDKIKGILCP